MQTPILAPAATPPVDRRRAVLAAVFDVDAILLFVLIGRRSHDEGGNFLVETGKVAASFLIALAVGWVVAQGWRAPRSARTGLIVWVTTVAGGMALRPAFGRDVPVSFVIVTALFTGLFLMGWRAVARRLDAQRASRLAR